MADIEQGYISTTSCILANLAMRTGRDPGVGSAAGACDRRRRGEPPLGPSVSQPVGASHAGKRVNRVMQRQGSWRSVALGFSYSKMITILTEFGIESRMEKDDYLQSLQNLAKFCAGVSGHAKHT